MSGVTISSVTFDKGVYNPGDTIYVTLEYTQTSTSGGTGEVVYQLTALFTDTVTSVESSTEKNFTVNSGTTPVPDPLSVTGSDNRPTPGTWAVYSNVMNSDGTGTAVLSSTA
jgi:hypothetical protein